ncbi:unnamed protein product [Rhizoctonia solani]|uniref:BTB domain-containing protein n=1 Tax=Rhizoctonia solani TaxID=456999 RepID=A0A8H3H6T6_9AGAM|nr:unnamed protein product [Rhizoctonia solani]
MPKRSTNGNASQQAGTAGSRKRAKKDEPGDNSNTPSSAPATVQKNTIPGVRDSNYYFEDGSVTVCVRHILSKVVHGSLLKAHSEDFCQKFDLCPQPGGFPAGGTCDEDAITIPEVQPSQFRHLMKIIYCLLALTPTAPNDKKVITSNFDSYLDIAILSRQFGMEKLEQWVKQELANLVHDSGKDLAEGFNISAIELHSRKQDDLKPKWDGEGIAPATHYYGFRLIEVIWYAKLVSDKSLLYGILSVAQYCCAHIRTVKFPISFLAITDLRKVAPSLYGFLFLLILGCGNSAWMGEEFTQTDRLAFFSA